MAIWDDKVKAIKERFTSKLTKESSAEEMQAINDAVADVDALTEEYKKSQDEIAKLKDVVVRVVSNQGSSDKPKDEDGGSKPRSMNEIVADLQKEQDSKEKK